MANTYFLRSNLKTYLFRGPEDRLLHLRPRRRPMNLDVELELARPDCSTLIGFFRLSENAGPVPVVTEGRPGGEIALRTAGGYLSASPNGEFAVGDQCQVFAPVAAEDVAADRDAVVEVARLPRSSAIPKIIHQIYIGDWPAPDAVEHNIGDLKRTNPGWTFRLWVEKEMMEFIFDHFGGEVLARYLRINPHYGAARADLFRYLCVYKLGGVYLDLKSGCRAALDTIVRADDEYLLSHWNQDADSEYRGYGRHPEIAAFEKGEFQQWHVIAAPGHPYLEQVINDVLANIDTYHVKMDGVGKAPTLRLTGPISYTLSLSKILEKHNHRVLDAASVGLVYKKIAGVAEHFPPSYILQSSPIIL